MPETGGGVEINLGTRFLVFPQAPYLPGYGTPETVWISTSPDQLRPGPEDARFYVRDPALPKEPYEYPFLPPFIGAANPPATAGPDGHFDQIPTQSREFLAAHAFACARRVLDIWESYLGRTIEWHFAPTFERLEIIPVVDWDNAQSGYGFLELGYEQGEDGKGSPYALNFDTIAHEMGHAILFSLIGMPENALQAADFGAFHEACSDIISLLSFLHFDSGVDRLLRRCQGNLFTLNELNRIVELTGERQIRLASNSRRMSEVTNEVHDRSRPFTGAVFDTMAEIFHAILVEQELADERLLTIDLKNFDEGQLEEISALTSASYAKSPFLFKSALTRARDIVGRVLVRTWQEMDASALTLNNASEAIVDTAWQDDPSLAALFEPSFQWRELL